MGAAMSAVRALFVFRANARVGLGHYMRSRHLSRLLTAKGAACFGLTGKTDVPLLELSSDFSASSHYETDDDVVDGRTISDALRVNGITHVVMDDYQLTDDVAQRLNQSGLRWMQQFDASRPSPFWAPIVVNSSPSVDYDPAMFPRKQKSASYLFGPAYAVLRTEFQRLRTLATDRRGTSGLVCLGGGDDQGAGFLIARGLCELGFGATLVCGHGSRSLEEAKVVVAFEGRDQLKVENFSGRLAELLQRADFAVVSGGTLSYEAACLGVPFVTVSMAGNQLRTCKGWEALAGAPFLGAHHTLDIEAVKAAMGAFVQDKRLRVQISQRGQDLVDGNGAARLLAALTDMDERIFLTE